MDTTARLRPSHRMPSALLAPWLRCFFLRLILLTSALASGITFHYGVPDDLGGIVNFVFALVTPTHHVGTAFGPRIFPLPVWTDIVLMILETCWYIYSATENIGWLAEWAGRDVAGFLELDNMVAILSAWGLALGLLALLILKVLTIITSQEASPMCKRVDVALLATTGPWWRYPVRAILGIGLWEARVPGEPKPLSILRGLLASCAIAALLIFGWSQAVVLPFLETEKTFYRQWRSKHDPPTFHGWHAIKGRLVLVWESHLGASSHIADAVTAISRLKNKTAGFERVLCPVERDTSLALTEEYEVAVVSCPDHIVEVPMDGHVVVVVHDWFPNYDLTVNFTGLLGSTEPGSAYDRQFDAVRVYVGLISEVGTIFHNTDPISLFPGTNILSVVRPVFRERIKASRWATFGFDTIHADAIAVVEQTIPNPFMDPPDSRYISTLGLTRQNIVNERTCIQDYRTKTILGGLSTIGGLGSFLSTLLVILVGTSLFTALFRSKPQSPFGLLHGVGSSSEKMADACNRKYPGLQKDMQKERAGAGVISLLLDTLIDIDELRGGKHKSEELEELEESEGHDGVQLLPIRSEQVEDEEQPLTAANKGPKELEEGQ